MKRLKPLLILAALAFLGCLPALIAGKIVWGFDSISGIRHMFTLTAQLKPGQVFLTQMAGGYPYGLDNAVGPNPLIKWWAAVGYDRLFWLFLWAHLFIAGWGVLRWLEGLGVRANIALAAAICWMFSAQMTGHLIVEGHPSFFATAWLGHYFRQAQDLTLKPNLKHTAALAFVFCCGLWDAHPPLLMMFGFAALTHALLRAWLLDALRPVVLLWLGLCGVFCFLACLPILLGILRLAQEGPRQGGLGLMGGIGGLPIESLLTFIVPGLFGRDMWGAGYLGRAFGSFNMVFVGAMWPLLACFQRGVRNRGRLALSLCVLLFLMLALGLPSAVLGVIQQAGFPLSLLRLPVRWVTPFTLCLLGLGALVLEEKLTSGKPLPESPWPMRVLGWTMGLGLALGMAMIMLPTELLKDGAAFLIRDLARLSNLAAAQTDDWRLGGMLITGESLAIGGLGIWSWTSLKNGKTQAALTGAVVAVFLPSFLDLASTHHSRVDIPVYAQVSKQDRILSLITHQAVEGKYFIMNEVFSQPAVASLLGQGYRPLQVSMPLPHAGWQGLLSGDPKSVSENGMKLNNRLLQLMNVKWIVTRANKPEFCPNQPRSIWEPGMEQRNHALTLVGDGPPKGLVQDFLCFPDSQALVDAGWESVREPESSQGFIWWRQTRPLSGAWFVEQAHVEADPYGALLKDPNSLLTDLPVSETPPAPPKGRPQVSASALIPVTWEAQADGYTVQVNQPRPGYAVLTVPFWKNLKAVDENGKEVSTFRVAGVFLGLSLGAGEHTVRISYDFQLRGLLIFAGYGWAMLLGILLWGLVRRKPVGP